MSTGLSGHKGTKKRRGLKNLVWHAAKSVALGGLYPWELQENWLMVERREMALSGLGAGFRGARVVHISDLHYSPLVLGRYLRGCVAAINAMEPDFVVVTGDFITDGRAYARKVAAVLGELTPRAATMACLGNHDHGMWHPRGLGGKPGLADYLVERLTGAGVHVMLNETRTFRRNGSSLQFVGIEDMWAPGHDPAAAFAKADRRLPTIALCHNPDDAHAAAGHGAQWVLSGHTHGRAKPPMRFFKWAFPTRHRHLVAGHYSLGPGKHLYVNRGLGYSRRVHPDHHPEITVFTLRTATGRSYADVAVTEALAVAAGG